MSTEPAWFKSSYSGSGGDNCVEVALHTGAVHVRDSKDTGRPHSPSPPPPGPTSPRTRPPTASDTALPRLRSAEDSQGPSPPGRRAFVCPRRGGTEWNSIPASGEGQVYDPNKPKPSRYSDR
ncbi:DUF397 domain-containing protein [Streptomyces sp. CEV 2-1]|uniref:DUF397 domain-containing protein n=1 Tax=Streptomyces sp. NBC_01260 TaxID=2903801 RepID=UPI000F4741B4